jgi:hypothetical protein
MRKVVKKIRLFGGNVAVCAGAGTGQKSCGYTHKEPPQIHSLPHICHCGTPVKLIRLFEDGGRLVACARVGTTQNPCGYINREPSPSHHIIQFAILKKNTLV